MIRIYIGYDDRESEAWHTLVKSIYKYASGPVAIIPVKNSLLPMFIRETSSRQSNEFAFSRFLVPYLNGYKGLAIWMDCDMMLRDDIYEVIKHIDINKAVSVVKHDYTPKDAVKYLGNIQYDYPRKNWSSFVVWNCGHIANRKVTPNLVNNTSGAHLHRFKWLLDEEIGSLPLEWNWLVGEYDILLEDVKNVHWTVGGPWFEEYKDADFADEWRSYGEG